MRDGKKIVALAKKYDTVVAVGHSERCNPVSQALKRFDIEPKFIETQRVSPYPFRSTDVGVVFDVMIHDIDIMHALVDGEVTDVRAVGIPVLSDEIDIANARLELSSGCVVNMTASRVSMNRVRKVRIFQSRAYFSLDYAEQSVACYRIEDENGGRPTIAGDPVTVDKGEPLVAELRDFVACVRTRDAVRVDGIAGRRAMETALKIRAALTLPAGPSSP